MMVDFKCDALYVQVSLHREPPEVGLGEKLSGSLYWWVGVPSLHLSDLNYTIGYNLHLFFLALHFSHSLAY